MNIDLGANYLQSKFQNTGLLQNKFVEVQYLDKKKFIVVQYFSQNFQSKIPIEDNQSKFNKNFC